MYSPDLVTSSDDGARYILQTLSLLVMTKVGIENYKDPEIGL